MTCTDLRLYEPATTEMDGTTLVTPLLMGRDAFQFGVYGVLLLAQKNRTDGPLGSRAVSGAVTCNDNHRVLLWPF